MNTRLDSTSPRSVPNTASRDGYQFYRLGQWRRTYRPGTDVAARCGTGPEEAGRILLPRSVLTPSFRSFRHTRPRWLLYHLVPAQKLSQLLPALFSSVGDGVVVSLVPRETPSSEDHARINATQRTEVTRRNSQTIRKREHIGCQHGPGKPSFRQEWQSRTPASTRRAPASPARIGRD